MRVIAQYNQPKGRVEAKPTTHAQRGFTLIELLVVIAITSILMTLIFKPLIDSYNLTSRASTQIDSQTQGRELMREVNRVLSDAVFVYDNAQAPIYLWFARQDGRSWHLPSRFSMVEYVIPAHQIDQKLGDTPIDPTTGLPITGSNLPPSQTGFALPLTPGRALGRLFLGLNDNTSIDMVQGDEGDENGNPLRGKPKKLYGNKFEEPRSVGNDLDNRYTVYKAEVLPYIPDPDQKGNPNPNYVPNLGLFHTIDKNGNPSDSKTDTIALHDPNFFYDNKPAGGVKGPASLKWAVPGWRDLNNNGTCEVWENWKAASASLVPSRNVDMVSVDRDDINHSVRFDPNGLPIVRPLAQFQPTFLQNDPGVPSSLDSAGNETPAAAAPGTLHAGSGFASATYSSQYTHWSTPFRVIIYRSDNPNSEPLAGDTLDYFQADGSGRIIHVKGLKKGDTPPNMDDLPDVGPVQQGNSDIFLNPNAEFAFTVDPKRGIVNFGFPHSVFRLPGNDPEPQRYSPTVVNNGSIDGQLRRVLDLKVIQKGNWAGLPLNKTMGDSPLRLFNTPINGTFRTARIVPGSEKVWGPDQRPGPHYGHKILYTRVPLNSAEPGMNEYKIRYEDENPQGSSGDLAFLRVGFIEFNSTTDNGKDGAFNFEAYNEVTGNPPINTPVYPPHSLPTVKTGPDGMLGGAFGLTPADPVEVSYEFQMNRPNDVVKVDYLTRELMNVQLQTRLYDPASSRPQIVELGNKIKVRNLQH